MIILPFVEKKMFKFDRKMTEKIRNHIKRCENTTLEKIDFSNKKYCLSIVYVESNSNLNIQANLCKTTTLGATKKWPL